MSTVALSMIVKDEHDKVAHIIDSAQAYFDEINIVISDKTTYNKLTKKYPTVNFKYRTWNDKFDEARNVSKAMCKTDYMFWIDADDEFDFRNIPFLVEQMDSGYDAIFLPYNYAQDENGNTVTLHWRERMIRLSKPFEWRGWVHESLISDEPYNSTQLNIEVKHHSGSHLDSLERNHKILLKGVEETDDPRYVVYLGKSYFSKGEYREAIKTLLDYIQVGGNKDDLYVSLQMISEAAYRLGDEKVAMEYAFKASSLIPEYPMAYWLLAQYEDARGNYAEAVEWVRTSESKPDPKTLAVWDPSARDRARLLAALAMFHAGHYNEALGWLKRIKDNSLTDDIYDDFVHEADKETFLTILPKSRQFYRSDSSLYESLSDEIKYDQRVKPLREAVTKPKKWDDKSIVIFCGQGYEEWGPHTLDKGMGGSEEAVVYLSRALAKLGWDVTVYAEADGIDSIYGNGWVSTGSSSNDFRLYNGGKASSPVWRPWKEIDTRDEFNVFVSWRAPQFAEKVNAKVKIVDLHDVVPAEIVTDQAATYFVKSQYHRDLYKHLPDNKFKIIGNGIEKEQFSE